ncbi:MAG: hypothetical protein VX911_09305 [Candidatus Latescibacterota bacterium]|nr:hypothetical protein [Candidatus Latescibacterota bacterium]
MNEKERVRMGFRCLFRRVPYEQAPSVMGGARVVRLWEILRRLDAKRHGPHASGQDL